MELARAFLRLVIPIAIVGLLVWLGEWLFPSMPARLKLLIRVIAVVVVVVWLLDRFGLYHIALPQ